LEVTGTGHFVKRGGGWWNAAAAFTNICFGLVWLCQGLTRAPGAVS
jgi:hypothetical protein